MLKITRAANGQVSFKLSGRMGAENVAELETLVSAEASGRRIVLDLKDLTLVDQDAVSFLKRCEADGIQLKNARHSSASGSWGNRTEGPTNSGGTNMAWGNAVLSENRNDVEACLTERGYEVGISARGTAESTLLGIVLNRRIPRPSGNEQQRV